MSIKLRSLTTTRIKFPPNKIKISRILQYANDITLFIKSEPNLESALYIIDSFGIVCALKLNRSKSVIIPLGRF